MLFWVRSLVWFGRLHSTKNDRGGISFYFKDQRSGKQRNRKNDGRAAMKSKWE